MVLGLLLIIFGFAIAARLSNPRYPTSIEGVVRQGTLLIPILVGSVLIWWGRGRSVLCLLSLALVLGGLAVALWGPEWGCVVDQPGEVCYLVAYTLPGIWLATVVAIGVALGLGCLVDERNRSRAS